MSIRVVIPSSPGLVPVSDVPGSPLRRPEHKTKRTVAIALFAVAALAANIADAVASNHNRLSGVSIPKRSWTSQYSPSDRGRYDDGDSARSRVKTEPWHGMFAPEVENSSGP
jgi:hypothetical protein